MPSADHFLELIRQSRRGKFKVYIGMSASVGKTCRSSRFNFLLKIPNK